MPIAKCQQQNLSEPVKTQHIEQYMQEIILRKHICRYRPWTIQKHSYLRRQRQEITDWKDVYTRQLGKYPEQADNQEKSNVNRNKPLQYATFAKKSFYTVNNSSHLQVFLFSSNTIISTIQTTFHQDGQNELLLTSYH